MNRNQIIQIAEEVGLLFPDSVEYEHPQHQRLISRLEKFAKEYYEKGYDEGYGKGYDEGAEDAISKERR